MPESAYEKARRLANENSLPGVDWDQYHDAKFDTLPENLKPEAFEAERETNRMQEHFKAVPSAKNPWGYFDRPGDYEQQEVDQSRQKLIRAALKKPFPQGMEMTHRVERGTWGGAIHDIKISDPRIKDERDDNVGSLTWDGTNGYIKGLFVDEGYRHLVPHILEAGHALSNAYGHVGPISSGELSKYSYKLAQKFAPSSIPYGASVEGVPVEHYEDPHYEQHEELGHDINGVSNAVWDAQHSLSGFGHPAYDEAINAMHHVNLAEESHGEFDHGSVEAHLREAKGYLANAVRSIKPENHSNSEGWQDRQQKLASVHGMINDVLDKHRALFG